MHLLHKRRPDIQVLRGIAVFAVVLFHTQESIFTAGYLGVDVFFVISGFVVTPLINRILLDDGDLSTKGSLSRLRSFYLRRFYRLAPALGVSLILSFVIILLVGQVSDHSRFASQGLAALFLLGNFGAYLYSGGNYFAPNPNPLIHLWSLSAEEQIYFLLPIVIFVVLFITRRCRRFSLFLLILVLGILAYILDSFLRIFPEFLQNYGISDVSGLMFYSPVGRLWEFCIGSCTYFLSTHEIGTVIRPRKYVNWLSITLLCSFLFLPINNFKFDSVLISIFTASAIFIKAFDSLSELPRRAAIWLGNRSYSIYLIHMPILYAAIYSPLFVSNRGIAISIAFVLSIIVGSIIYEKIEERFRIGSLVTGSNRMHARTLLICFMIVPILLFAGMRVGADKHYWGHDPNPVAPVYPSKMNYNCYLSMVPCSYPVMNPKGVALLIGDSHAASLFQAFTESMALTGISSYVWQKSGCQFITRKYISHKNASSIRYSKRDPGSKQSCFEHNDSITGWLKTHPKAIVFISQRSTSIRPSKISEADYRNIVINNLLYLKRLSARLIVIGPNPEFPDASKFFKGGLVIWQKAYIPPKSFPTSSMIAEPVRDNSVYLSRLPSEGIGYIDSIVPFCNRKACTRWYQSVWLYTDHDHLSVYGAERLKPFVRQQIALHLK